MISEIQRMHIHRILESAISKVDKSYTKNEEKEIEELFLTLFENENLDSLEHFLDPVLYDFGMYLKEKGFDETDVEQLVSEIKRCLKKIKIEKENARMLGANAEIVRPDFTKK